MENISHLTNIRYKLNKNGDEKIQVQNDLYVSIWLYFLYANDFSPTNIVFKYNVKIIPKGENIYGVYKYLTLNLKDK